MNEEQHVAGGEKRSQSEVKGWRWLTGWSRTVSHSLSPMNSGCRHCFRHSMCSFSLLQSSCTHTLLSLYLSATIHTCGPTSTFLFYFFAFVLGFVFSGTFRTKNKRHFSKAQEKCHFQFFFLSSYGPPPPHYSFNLCGCAAECTCRRERNWTYWVPSNSS